MIDTLKMVDLLREAGFDEKQARAIAELQKQTADKSGLATQHDINRLEARIESLENLLKWGTGLLLVPIMLILTELFLG